MHDKLRTLLFPTGAHTRLALALLILRLFVGIAFTQHGSGKLMHPSEFATEFGIPVWLALIGRRSNNPAVDINRIARNATSS